MGEVRGVRVHLREARRADPERLALGDQRGQLGRVAEPARVWAPLGLATGWIAPQRQHVLDPGLGDRVEDLVELLPRGADARQMGHGLDAQIPLDPPGDLHGSLAGRASGSVRDRREIGFERLERLQRGPEVPLAVVGLGREELEREDWLVGRGEDLVDAHGPGNVARLTRVCQGWPGTEAMATSRHWAAPPFGSRSTRPSASRCHR